jgi:isopentenyl phosphate kinase
MDLVFVKLGGSLITDKSQPYTMRPGAVERVAAELRACLATGRVRLLVGHGAGSFPHTSAARYQTHRGLVSPESVRGLCEVSRDVFRLNRLVVDALLTAGIPAMPFQPSAARLSNRGCIEEWYTGALGHALGMGVVPVVFGDVSMDRGQGVSISSTEDALLHLARVFRPARVVMATRVEGLLGQDGEVVPVVTRAGLEGVLRLLAPPEGADVTGGMRHKVERMLDLADTGAETVMVSGLHDGRLADAVLGNAVVGTAARTGGWAPGPA